VTFSVDDVTVESRVVVLLSWSWSRGASRPALLDLGLGLETCSLGLGLEKKVLATFITTNS